MPKRFTPFDFRRLDLAPSEKQLSHHLRSVERGFTLLELLVVVAIVGIISAVALPQYLRYRGLAEAASSIGEAQALAKHCAVGMRSAITSTGTDPFMRSTFSCNGSQNVFILSRQWSSDATGAVCLAQRAASWHTIAAFLVDRNGDMYCMFI